MPQMKSQEVIDSLTEALKDINTLYRASCVNLQGEAIDTGEPYVEIIA